MAFQNEMIYLPTEEKEGVPIAEISPGAFVRWAWRAWPPLMTTLQEKDALEASMRIRIFNRILEIHHSLQNNPLSLPQSQTQLLRK